MAAAAAGGGGAGAVSSGKTYVIKSVGDFAQVPEGRLGTCLREFRVWLKYRQVLKAMETDGLVKAGRGVDDFVWCDDDLGEARINLVVEHS
jgi:hypothetical protein